MYMSISALSLFFVRIPMLDSMPNTRIKILRHPRPEDKKLINMQVVKSYFIHSDLPQA